MSPREHLRQLVDELPESELVTAERVLVALAASVEPLSRRLDSAPADDEPEAEGERAGVAEAWAEHRAGESLSTARVRSELGLD